MAAERRRLREEDGGGGGGGGSFSLSSSSSSSAAGEEDEDQSREQSGMGAENDEETKGGKGASAAGEQAGVAKLLATWRAEVLKLLLQRGADEEAAAAEAREAQRKVAASRAARERAEMETKVCCPGGMFRPLIMLFVACTPLVPLLYMPLVPLLYMYCILDLATTAIHSFNTLVLAPLIEPLFSKSISDQVFPLSSAAANSRRFTSRCGPSVSGEMVI